jgi:hypothetical protein
VFVSDKFNRERDIFILLIFLLMFGQPSLSRIVEPKEIGSICLSFEKVTLHAGHEVITEVDGNILLIVVDPKVIVE